MSKRAKKRARIAEAFTAAVAAANGDATRVSNVSIAKETSAGERTVRAVRLSLGLPRYVTANESAYPDILDYIDERTRWEGEHAFWTGPVDKAGCNVVTLSRRNTTVGKVVFENRYRRVADGYVKPRCGRTHCIAAGHLTDRAMREGRA